MLSNDMMQAMRAMVDKGSATPDMTGLSIRTFNALVRRGYAKQTGHDPRRFTYTQKGRDVFATQSAHNFRKHVSSRRG